MYRFRASEITVEMPLAQGDPQQRHVAAGFLAALPLPFTNAGCTPPLGQSRADIERDRRTWGAVPSPAVQHQTQPPERRHNANAGALKVSPSSGRICCSLGAERRGARLKGRPSGRQGLHPDGRSTACRSDRGLHRSVVALGARESAMGEPPGTLCCWSNRTQPRPHISTPFDRLHVRYKY